MSTQRYYTTKDKELLKTAYPLCKTKDDLAALAKKLDTNTSGLLNLIIHLKLDTFAELNKKCNS